MKICLRKSGLLEMQESQLKEVRNAGEAHKNRDVERQIRPIETLSVEESRTIIDEFCTILIDYFGALAGFHKSRKRSVKAVLSA